MKTSRRTLPLVVGLIVAAGLLAPAPAFAQRSNYSKTMEDVTGYNSHGPRGEETLAKLGPIVPVAIAVVVGLVVLAVVFKIITSKSKDPDAVASNDPWVQAQMRKGRGY
jgi:hypothetical protein